MEAIRQCETPNDLAIDRYDLGFLPFTLKIRCRALIQSYHEVHGFGSLPDILWKSRLEPLIARTRELNAILRKASTTRSAKKAQYGFMEIASVILALEILSTNFSGWSSAHPDAADLAMAILGRDGRHAQSPLMEFYLYPPKYRSPAAITALAMPATFSVAVPSDRGFSAS